MQIVYARQPLPHGFSSSIFLCGPSPRDAETPSWRVDAIRELESASFDGVVFCPELEGGVPQDGLPPTGYDDQMDWELEAMRRADVILFWVPATQDKMPALTTRVELGLQAQSGKVVFGAPPDSYKTRYMEKLCTRLGVPVHTDLKSTVEAAADRSKNGCARFGAETLVPLDVFRSKHFQEWYSSQKAAGHELVDVKKIDWVLRVGPGFPLFQAIHVAIKVNGEDRVKSNESVIIRPSISAICAYEKATSLEASRVLLVKEYRTAAMNSAGFVFEIPGGSSFKPSQDPLQTASEEFHKEAGVLLAKDRFRFVGTRQIAGTTAAYRAHLFAVELSKEEMDAFSAMEAAGAIFGDISETERTYPCVRTVSEILAGDIVDAANVGLVLQTLLQS